MGQSGTQDDRQDAMRNLGACANLRQTTRTWSAPLPGRVPRMHWRGAVKCSNDDRLFFYSRASVIPDAHMGRRIIVQALEVRSLYQLGSAKIVDLIEAVMKEARDVGYVVSESSEAVVSLKLQSKRRCTARREASSSERPPPPRQSHFCWQPLALHQLTIQ
ncbi:hypothetical protein BKA80DRAFT_106975 [Phyllosticta citrichinensis]